jgi:heme-degrading monooxygenase HmoA
VVLEVATLNVRAGQEAAFEAAFAEAKPIIVGMKGFISLHLQKGVEHPSRYLLLVRWQTIEDHTIGFRQSPLFPRWKELLHHFYDPAPTIEHFTDLLSA